MKDIAKNIKEEDMKTYEVLIFKRSDASQRSIRDDVIGVSKTEDLVTGTGRLCVSLKSGTILEYDDAEYGVEIKKEEKRYTLVAEWDNGTKREFKGLDRLNLIINQGELELWCEQNKFAKPKFIVTEEAEATA